MFKLLRNVKRKLKLFSRTKRYKLDRYDDVSTTEFPVEGISYLPINEICFTNPANFRLTKAQNFAISLLTGKTVYQLDASRELKVTINNSDLLSEGPQITKSSNEAIFKFFMKEPLSHLVIEKAASSTRLSLADVLRIKKFDSNTTLSLYGNYLFENN